MTISVMITTRNRCADLKRTLAALQQMSPMPDEILVTADGCTDNTVEMVRVDYPHCRLTVNEPGLGSIPSRDQMLRDAVGELVLSLDDDSYPLDRDFFGRLPDLFESHPEASVITFPELTDSGPLEAVRTTPTSTACYLPAYANCAAAMRREFYLKVPGFPRFFSHAYEEPDFALQCYQHGSAVWFEPSLIIRHHFSTKNRCGFGTHQLNARNELWSVWLRCPWPWLPVISLYRIWRQFRFAWSQGWRWAVREPLWWVSSLAGISKCSEARVPASWTVYSAWMRLSRVTLESRPQLLSHFQR